MPISETYHGIINVNDIILPHIISLAQNHLRVLIDFSLTVTAATLIFISVCGLAISSAKEGKSGFIYNLVMNL